MRTGNDTIHEPELISELLGGKTTTMRANKDAFSQPARNLPLELRARFEVGDSLFNQNWVIAPASTTARDGLGPLFNARSCSGCHSKDGRGHPQSAGEKMLAGILYRLSIPGADGQPIDEPIYGGQFNHQAITGIKGEGKVAITYEEIHGSFADGSTYTLQKPIYTFHDLNYGEMDKNVQVSPRVAQQVIGLGLLDVVSEESILAYADPDDRDGDGISGRPNYVTDVVTHKPSIGRFGWKANMPNLRQQVAGAFRGDVGITSSLFPEENHTASQAAAGLADLPDGGKPELTDKALASVTFYNQHLAVPRQRNADDPEVIAGQKIFKKIRCDSCHRMTMHTPASVPGLETLEGQTFHPMTDLLLHDMGPALADNRPDGLANGQEWRTPPLWGIGLIPTVNKHSRLLHDGRARNIEEAILWHGGEAEQAQKAYRELIASERAALIKFLESL